MTDDPNRCRWCWVYRHPVARMVADHEAKCLARPSDGEATASDT